LLVAVFRNPGPRLVDGFGAPIADEPHRDGVGVQRGEIM
jgi:hypothetical protein